MSEENVGVFLAGLAFVIFLWFVRKRTMETQQPIGSTEPIAGTLAAAASPADFIDGPSYFIANQPYYFAPPVGNMMPTSVASNTIATNAAVATTEDGGGCGC